MANSVNLPDTNAAAVAWVANSPALKALAAGLGAGAVRWCRDAGGNYIDGDDDMHVCEFVATADARDHAATRSATELVRLDAALADGLVVLARMTFGRYVGDNCAPPRAVVALSADGARGVILRRVGRPVPSDDDVNIVAVASRQGGWVNNEV